MIKTFAGICVATFLLWVQTAHAQFTPPVTLHGLGSSGCRCTDHCADALPSNTQSCRRQPVACGCGGNGCGSCCEPRQERRCSNCSDPSCTGLGCAGACSGTPSCDCLQCCDRTCVITDFLFLSRSRNSRRPLVRNQTTGDVLLDARDFDHDTEFVPRVFVRRDCCDCTGWEGGWMTGRWEDARRAGEGVSPLLELPGVLAGASAPGTIFEATNRTDLDSFEFNLRRRCNECLTWVGGVRYINLDDQLRVDQIAPGARTNMYRVDTDNNLYGLQLGADAQVFNCGKPFHVDVLGRVGLYYNDASQRTVAPVLTPLVPLVADRASDSSDSVAFVGELGFRGVYQVSNRVALRAGYHMMWIEGVALAPDQLATTSLAAPGSASINDDGGLFFHGALIGFDYCF